MAEGELREEVRGKAGNALYIGPRSGDVETTPAIQQLTRGNIVGNAIDATVYETTPSIQELTRVTSLGKTRGHKKSTNDITTRGSQTIVD